MSKIDDLIKKLCPNGVEYKKLISVANVQYGFPFDSKLFTEDDSYIPLIRIRDVKPAKAGTYYKGDFSDTYIIKKGDILVGMDGNFNLEKWNDRDGLLNQRVCKIYSKDDSIILNNYLYHLLSPVFKEIEDGIKGGTVKHLSVSVINKIEIPVPPIEIQQEIVRILDNFTNLTAELQAELQARKEQYEYYRNNLLLFDKDNDDVKWMKMGDVMNICRGASPRPISYFITDEPNGINWIKIGDVSPISKYITSTKEKITKEGAKKSRFLHKGDFILSNSMSFGRPYILKIDGCIHDGWISLTEFENNLNPDFLYHLLRSDAIQKFWKQSVGTGAVSNLNADIVRKTVIPIPPLSEQERIVSILDKFEALVNDLTSGLPAEIAALQEQYEYYRNKLLTFERSA